MSRSAWGLGADAVMDWRLDAACRGTTAPDAWFVSRTAPSRANQMALEICRSCPVMDACRGWYESLPSIHRQSVIAGGVRWNSRGDTVHAQGRFESRTRGPTLSVRGGADV